MRASKPGGGMGGPQHEPIGDKCGADALSERKRRLKDTLRCPHCGEGLQQWLVPESPFTEWPNEFFFVCFNDACPYFEQGWSILAGLGSFGSYRFVYDPVKDACYAFPVLSPTTARG